jgi:hypothetical protein
MTRKQEDRRIGLALVLLIVAFGLHGQCAPAQAGEAECNSGDLYVRGNGDEVVACVGGQLQPMLTLDESETRVRNVMLLGAGLGLMVGLIFGAQVRRTRCR